MAHREPDAPEVPEASEFLDAPAVDEPDATPAGPAEAAESGDRDEHAGDASPAVDGDDAPASAPQPEPGDELETLRAERDQYKELAQRVRADFENYRKRALAQQNEQVERATGRLAEVLLPVLDACELAYQHGAEGIEPIWSKLIGELQREGLEALDLAGQLFDPEVAEAVVHEPGDHDHPIVSEVLRTGYKWHGRLLRAALVKVKG